MRSPLEIGVGQDTLVSGVGIAFGNMLMIEGILDTAVNIPLVWYDVQSAAGKMPTFVELRWTEEIGWHFIIYPQEAEVISNE